MIDLFWSNYGMVIFSKTEKKLISQQKSKGSYNYDVHVERGAFRGVGGWLGLKICHVLADFFCF